LVNTDPTYPNYGKFNLNQTSAWTTSGNFFIIRNLMDFNIAAIPSTAFIMNAKIDLYFATNGFFGGGHTGQNECYIARIIDPWVDTLVNWSNQPGISSLHKVNLPASTSPSQDYLNINVTQLVQDMVSNPGSSFGFMIYLQNEMEYRSISFASGDHDNQLLCPKLTVTYSNNIGFDEPTQSELPCSIIPNPAKEELSLTVENTGIYNLKIFLPDGRLIKETDENMISGIVKTLNINDYKAGLYIFAITKGKETTLKKILIY